ncbi:MAG: aminotransferase class V-fold PLP-dependent enzyme [Candidatus Bathyarchaeota archaeon]
MEEIDWVRSEFPIVERMIYLDMAYGNPLAKSVKFAMEEYMEAFQRNGVSVERARAYKILEDVRAKFAALVNAKASEVAFIKNTSEGLNIAARGIKFEEGENIVLNELEHPNNTYCWRRLEAEGIVVRIVPQREGRVDIQELVSAIDHDTRVVAVASTTNMGFRFDLEELGRVCEENGALLVVDAVQSLGIEPLDVEAAGVDILSASAHKGLLGPHGIGFFYCSEEILDQVDPPYVAGISYEESSSGEALLKGTAGKFEYGNYNYLGGHAMIPALGILEKVRIENIKGHCFGLANKFRGGLCKMGVEVMDSPLPSENSHIVTFNVEGMNVKEVREKLIEKRVMLSAHYGDLRASFALFNNKEDVEGALEVLRKVICN